MVRERWRQQQLDVVGHGWGSGGLQGSNGTILPLESSPALVLEEMEGGGLHIDPTLFRIGNVRVIRLHVKNIGPTNGASYPCIYMALFNLGAQP